MAGVLALVSPALAIDLDVTAEDVERALVIARERARERDRERTSFHTPYIINVNTEFVDRVEVITEFRRVVLLAEDQILKGDRAFAYSSRVAIDAVLPWKHRVSVVARVRFHPLNNYVSLPDFEVALDGPDAEQALIGVLKDPIFGFSEPDKAAPIMGAVVEGVFDALLVGQTQRTVTFKLSGKVLAATRVDFAMLD